MGMREKIAEALYEAPTGTSGMSKLLAKDAHQRRVNAVMEVVDARVRELEAENTRLKDTIAARIVEEEHTAQEQITKEPLNSWLAGLLFGLQRARDIVAARQLKEEK